MQPFCLSVCLSIRSSVYLSVCLFVCCPCFCKCLLVSFVRCQGPGSVPLSNLDSRQSPDDPHASKQAHQFFKGLAQQAVQAGVAVDVVAVGQAAVNVPLLGPLAQKTGGVVMTHQRKHDDLKTLHL